MGAAGRRAALNVLSFSYCFPTPARPSWGVFVAQRLAAMARHCALEVVAPVPTFPLLTRQGPPGAPTVDGLRVAWALRAEQDSN